MGEQDGNEPPIELGGDPRSMRSRGPSIAPRYTPLASSIRHTEPEESFFDRMKFYLGMGFIVALLIGGLVWMFGAKIMRRISAQGRAAAAIEPHVQELAQLAHEDHPAPTATAPYITGKVVVIDDVRREVDPAFYELPAGLYAKDASELGTLVLVSCGNDVLGEYRAKGSAGGPLSFKAFAINCAVVVIDWAAKTRTRNNFVSKEKPPLTQHTLDGNWYAPRPTKDIADWLIALPRH